MNFLTNFISTVPSKMVIPYKILAQPTIDTALGKIPTEPGAAVSSILLVGVGAGGILAFGLVAVGAFTILTSTGEPEKLMNGRDMITNALMGLALIVLSVFVIEFLGWDLLNIGGLTGVDFSHL